MVEPRGGKTAKVTKKEAIDSYRAKPRPGLATMFVNNFMPWGKRSLTPMCSENGGVKITIALCDAWNWRMQVFFHQWAELDFPKLPVFEDFDLLNALPAAMKVVLEALPADHAASLKFNQICEIMPRVL